MMALLRKYRMCGNQEANIITPFQRDYEINPVWFMVDLLREAGV